MGDLVIRVADGVIDATQHFARWSDKVRLIHFEEHHIPVVPLEWQLVANVLLQYNTLKRDLGANLRIGYTFRPGSDLFLVFNERRGDATGLWTPRERAGLVKLTYLLRF